MGFKAGFSKFINAAEYVLSPTLMAVGVRPILVPIIMHGMKIAETSLNDDGSPKSGAQKKALVLDAVSTGITGINTVKPNTVDPDVVKVVDEGIDTAVGVINAITKKPITIT